MRRSSQDPHMHVEFAGQEVKWQPMMRRLNSLVSLVCRFSAVSQAESNQPVVETC
jgi:hypothetical protein